MSDKQFVEFAFLFLLFFLFGCSSPHPPPSSDTLAFVLPVPTDEAADKLVQILPSFFPSGMGWEESRRGNKSEGNSNPWIARIGNVVSYSFYRDGRPVTQINILLNPTVGSKTQVVIRCLPSAGKCGAALPNKEDEERLKNYICRELGCESAI